MSTKYVTQKITKIKGFTLNPFIFIASPPTTPWIGGCILFMAWHGMASPSSLSKVSSSHLFMNFSILPSKSLPVLAFLWTDWRKKRDQSQNYRPVVSNSFPRGPQLCKFSSNQLQLTPAWKFLVILNILISWIRCVWLWLELNASTMSANSQL